MLNLVFVLFYFINNHAYLTIPSMRVIYDQCAESLWTEIVLEKSSCWPWWCCSSVSSWTTHKSDLILHTDFEFVGVFTCRASTEGQGCHSRCRNERRLVNGRARGVRYACTASEHWTVDTRFFFCSFTLGVVSSDTRHGRSWLMVFRFQMEGFRREHSFLDPH